MGRVTQEQARRNREHVVETASQLFRAQGTGVSVTDLMNAAGLTHGGFYKQFASKDALVAEATAHAFQQFTARHTALDERYEDRAAARRAMVEAYLSVEHRDGPGDGCPTAGFAGDLARTEGDPRTRRVYADGVREFADWLASAGGDTAADDGLAQLSTLVGALLLARTTAGTPLSEEILTAAARALTAED